MNPKYFFLFLFVFVSLSLSVLHSQELTSHRRIPPCDTCTDNRQFVSWGLSAGPNLTGYRFKLQDAPDNPDHTYPRLGLEAGTYFEYHITSRWSSKLVLLADLERLNMKKNDTSNLLTTFGLDVELLACRKFYKDKLIWFAELGPYAHFVFFNHIDPDGNITNPYTRIIAGDPHTGKPRFALNDFNAGASFSFGFQTPNHWQYSLNVKFGISDILNQDSHTYFIKPYHIAIHISYHFF